MKTINAINTHPSVLLMKNGLNKPQEMSKFYFKLFVLSQFNAAKLFWLFVIFWGLGQLFMVVVEIYFFGKPSSNFIDPLMTGAIFGSYLRAISKLSNFLIDHALNSDNPKIYVVK